MDKFYESHSFIIATVIAILMILLFAGIGEAVPVEDWNRTFGGTGDDYAYSVRQTSDGGYIFAGGTNAGYAWLVKIYANGSQQWNNTFKFKNSKVKSVQQTLDGGYILAGSKRQYESSDAWLIKTDANGNELWNRTSGIFGKIPVLPEIENNEANFVSQTSDAGFIIAGYTSRGAPSYDNALLIKTDANGTQQWYKIFSGKNHERAYSVQQTADRGYILVASVTTPDDRFLDETWLIKTDANGNQQWKKVFGKIGGARLFTVNYRAYYVQQTSDGGYILAGDKESFWTDRNDAWVIKTDAEGNKQWEKTFEGETDDWFYSVQQTSDNGYILTGTTGYDVLKELERTDKRMPLTGDIWLVKLKGNGDLQWKKVFDSMQQDWGYSVQQTTDGGYIIAGTTASYGAEGLDAWLIKLSRETAVPTEKAAGFEIVLAIGALLSVHLCGRKRG